MHDNHLPNWAVAVLACLSGVCIALAIQLIDLRDDHDDTLKLVGGLIQHEEDQIELLCAKGVYVSKEACGDGE